MQLDKIQICIGYESPILYPLYVRMELEEQSGVDRKLVEAHYGQFRRSTSLIQVQQQGQKAGERLTGNAEVFFQWNLIDCENIVK